MTLYLYYQICKNIFDSINILSITRGQIMENENLKKELELTSEIQQAMALTESFYHLLDFDESKGSSKLEVLEHSFCFINLLKKQLGVIKALTD